MELLLADIGLRPSMHIEDTAKNIWIRLALETGADVSAVATEAGTIPPDNPYLRFAVPTHNHGPFGMLPRPVVPRGVVVGLHVGSELPDGALEQEHLSVGDDGVGAEASTSVLKAIGHGAYFAH